MTWTVEYYEQPSGRQPAEIFEDAVDRTHPRLAAKLALVAEALESAGYQLGGGLVEKCHGYADLWEIRAIHAQTLARELFGFDGSRVVLLHGYVKRSGETASVKDLDQAAEYWQEYRRTRHVSPEQPT